MSLFIGGLAFAGLESVFEMEVKLGVLTGSILSGIAGTFILMTVRREA
jgi:NhaA family Na+:H+ antiporter